MDYIDNARHCPVLIDDIETRHNYMVFRGMDEEQARDLAMSRGAELAVRISGVVAAVTYPYSTAAYKHDHPDDHKGHAVRVRRSSEGYVNNEVLEPLTKEYEVNEIFRQDVDAQVERGLRNKLVVWSSHVSEPEYKLGQERLARFVLEETAVTIGLVRMQYEVELYAGPPIQIVVDLFDPTANKYPRLRERINTTQSYGHVNLGIRRT